MSDEQFQAVFSQMTSINSHVSAIAVQQTASYHQMTYLTSCVIGCILALIVAVAWKR